MSEQYWVAIYGACVVLLLNPVYSFVCFRKSTPQAQDIFAFYLLDAFAQVCRLLATRVAYDTESDTFRQSNPQRNSPHVPFNQAGLLCIWLIMVRGAKRNLKIEDSRSVYAEVIRNQKNSGQVRRCHLLIFDNNDSYYTA